MNVKLIIGNVRFPKKTDRKRISSTFQTLLLNGSEIAFHRIADSHFLLQEVQINGFILGFHNLLIEQAMEIDFVFVEKCAVLIFVLEKSAATLKSNNTENIPIQNNTLVYPSFNYEPFRLQLDKGPHEFLFISFSRSMFEKIFPSELNQNGNGQNQSHFLGPVEISKKIHFSVKMILQYAKSSPLPIFYINRRCLDLLNQFTKDFATSRQLQKWIDQKRPELEMFKKDIVFNLADHDFLRKRLPLLAKQMNITMYQLKKITNQTFGMSLPAFIKAKRMEMAMELLIRTTIPIGEIVVSIGYNEFSAFSRAFTVFFGKPPSYL